MIVEDDASMALALASALHSIGDGVEIARTWADALSAVATGGFGLAAVDLQLTDSPRGITLGRLRDLHALCPTLKIVVMSGLELTLAEVETALTHGACDCIVKTRSDLRKTIQALIPRQKPIAPPNLGALGMLLAIHF